MLVDMPHAVECEKMVRCLISSFGVLILSVSIMEEPEVTVKHPLEHLQDKLQVLT